MSVDRITTHILLLAILGLITSCAKPDSRVEAPVKSEHHDELKLIRHLDISGPLVDTSTRDIDADIEPWLLMEIRYRGGSSSILAAYADQLVCYRRWRPWAHGGYVVFEAGTDSPVGYWGDFGACIAEPPIAARYNDVDELTCNFPEDRSTRVHAFAWPAETQGEEDALNLSRKRARAIEVRLGSTALPTRVDGVKAHGTKRTRNFNQQGAVVVGAYFEITPPIADVSSAGPAMTPQFLANVADISPDRLRRELESVLALSPITRVPEESVSAYDDPGFEVVEDDDGEFRNVFRPYVKLTYRNPSGDNSNRARAYQAAWTHSDFRQADIVRWAEDTIDSECASLEPATMQSDPPADKKRP